VAYTDKTLTCVDCQAPFTFSARDQEFHATKGFTNEPKRCPSCRQNRRQQRGDSPASAGEGAASGASRGGGQPVYTGPRAQSQGRASGPGNRGGAGGRGRGPRRDFDRGGRDGDSGIGGNGKRSFDAASNDGPRSYTATCMACGKDTTVSADSGNRVIFCQECYSKMTAMASS